MSPAPAFADPAVEELARSVVTAAVGTGRRIVRLEPVPAGGAHLVLLVTVDRPACRLVLKVAGLDARPVLDHERAATATALAAAAGAPVPAVLAADSSGRAGGWQYLLQEHVDGVEWRRLRPLLDPDQVAAAHRQIAEAVLATQSVHFGSFGELNGTGEPAGDTVAAALRRRAQLPGAHPARRELFLELLERDAALFRDSPAATLCHDDLHHGNVLFRADGARWRLAALLDWDKAWAGPAESDLARLAFWDDMTGPGFWDVYRAAVPPAEGYARRALVHQLLWCLEYPAGTARHAADTAALLRRLGSG